MPNKALLIATIAFCWLSSSLPLDACAKVRAEKSLAVVATQFIAKGSLITEELIQVEAFPSLPANAIQDRLGVVGRCAKTDIRPGRPILAYQIKLKDLVKKNDPVEIIYEQQNVKITMKGVALENGALNQSVKVKGKHQAFTGKVIAPMKVIIE